MVTMSSSSTVSSLSHPSANPATLPLLSAVLEGFVDGILVLSEDGTCIHSNQKGRSLCRDLSREPGRESSPGSGQQAPNPLPACIRALCAHLIESRRLYPDMLLVLTQEFTAAAGHTIRARIQWIDLPDTPSPSLLVSLENTTRQAHASALLEAIQYNLTPREQTVWLLRRANRTYEEIAKELYITVNTVKRHLKSIYAKRREVTEGLAN